MSGYPIEAADIFQQYGPQWRIDHQGHVSLEQLKVMSAIEHCRTGILGGHVLYCESCKDLQIAYNSCRNRHCPKCQSSAAKRWLEARQVDVLPVDYYHVVFSLPARIAEIAYYNKSTLYKLLFQAASETLRIIAIDPKHLGAQIGMIMVLHTWGSALTHHPHVHCIVPGGGLSPDKQSWVACRPGFFLSVRVLSRLFRRLFMEKLQQAYQAQELCFYGDHKNLFKTDKFEEWLQPCRQQEWVVYAKKPFAGPQAVLAYLSRYTHRIAIANSRLVRVNDAGVTFKWKDYRQKGRTKYKTMTLPVDEFIRRFLLHVLPKGFHRIRHYGLLANASHVTGLTKAKRLLAVPIERIAETSTEQIETPNSPYICRKCQTSMVVVASFANGYQSRAPPFLKQSCYQVMGQTQSLL